MITKLTLPQFINAGVHLGHKSSVWNPKMLPYIYMEKNNMHIIDLVQSAINLKKAESFLETAAKEKKTFLFICTKPIINSLVLEEAKRSNSFYVTHRWLGGMLTNWKTVKGRIKRLKDLEKEEADLHFDLLTKKEAVLRKKELSKLRGHLEGVKEMDKLPDVVIIVDQNKEMIGVRECKKLGIPIICILDTNCNPDLVDFPIPGNDDGVQSVKLILETLANGILEGKSKISN